MTENSILEEPVLVLDKNYTPVEVTTVRDAFDKLCRDSAVILDKYQVYDLEAWIEYSDMVVKTSEGANVGNLVRTPRHAILAPDVILVTDYSGHIKSGHVIRYSRSNIFQRDGYSCQYCSKTMSRRDLTLDHVIPKSRGGRATWSNIVTACKPCNSRKGNRTPQEANMQVLSQPSTPTWKEAMKLPQGKDSWIMYL